jgi:hypothetical protein
VGRIGLRARRQRPHSRTDENRYEPPPPHAPVFLAQGHAKR